MKPNNQRWKLAKKKEDEKINFLTMSSQQNDDNALVSTVFPV